MVKTHRAFVALFAVLCLAVTMPVQAADYEKYIPAETEAVVQLNFKQLFSSSMLKDAMGALKTAMAAQGAALKEIGFDPFTDLQHVVVAIPGGGNIDKSVVLIRGKFDVAKIEAAAEKAGAGADLKVHKIGSTKVFESKLDIPQAGQQGVFMAFLDSATVAIANSKESVTDTISRKDGKTKGALKKEMTDLIGKMDPKLTMGVAVLGTVAGQAEVSDRINNITGGITLTSEAKADFVIAAKNADTAKELEALIGMGLDQAKQILPLLVAQQKQLAPLVDLIAVINVTSAGSNVTIKGQLSKEDVEKAIKKAGG